MMGEDGELPAGWISPSIGQIAANVVVGYVGPVRQHYIVGGIPFLMGKNIKNGALKLIDLERVSPAFHGSQPKSALSFNDVVVVRIGRSGEAAVVPKDLGPANCGGLVVIKEPFGAIPSYLAAFLNSPQGQKQSDGEVRGMTRRTLNTGSIEAAKVPLPPLPEQHRIVAKLEALTEKSRQAKEALDAIPPLLERFRQSVLAAAFRGDLTDDWRAKNPDVEPADKLLQRIRTERRRRWEEAALAKVQAKGKTPGDDRWKEKYEEPEPIDTEGLPDLPEGWCWTSAEFACGSVRDGTHDTPAYVDIGVPLITSKNLLSSGLDFGDVKMISHADHQDISLRSRVDEGDVLFAMIGTIGNPVVVGNCEPFSIKNVALFKGNDHILNPRFLCYWLKSSAFNQWLMPRLKGSSQRFAPLSLLRSIPIPVPPLDEQMYVVESVQHAYEKIENVDRLLASSSVDLGQLNRSILAKAFRGDLVPQDPSDEPASVLLDRIRRERAAAETAKAKKAPRRPR